MKKLFLTFIASVTLVSTTLHAESVPNIKTPTQTLLEYHELSKTNLDFEIEASHYSIEKQKEVIEKISLYAKAMKLESDEQAKEKYMGFKSRTTKCLKLEPISETVDNEFVNLEFSALDICSEAPVNGDLASFELKVRMINEDGWKIDKYKLVIN